ncbi:MAG: ABC transporter permease [Clostridia bacterium]|nr:ABC transporter permease [Clostridia bacterium]
MRHYDFLIRQLVSRDFNTKYRQSLLGVVWSFLNPLLTMTVQYIVFSTLFSTSIDNFPVYLLTGIVLFNFFSEACTLGLESIVSNGSLINKVYMPKYIYPFSRTLSSLINMLITLIPLLMLMLFTGTPITWSLLLMPIDLLLLFGFTLGLTLLLCTLNVFFRDTRFLWSVLVLLWTYLTPLFYPESIIPFGLRTVYRMNPMYQFITFLRAIAMEGTAPTPANLLGCLIASAGMLLLGSWVFHRHQDHFVFHL